MTLGAIVFCLDIIGTFLDDIVVHKYSHRFSEFQLDIGMDADFSYGLFLSLRDSGQQILMCQVEIQFKTIYFLRPVFLS